MPQNNIALFESKEVRRYYDSLNEIWYFSLVDIVGILTDSVNSTDYLKKLRKRDTELGSYIGTNCPLVDMVTATGKKHRDRGEFPPTEELRQETKIKGQNRKNRYTIGKDLCPTKLSPS